MKKIKKIAAIAMAMALTVGSCVSVGAESKTIKIDGTVADSDLNYNIDLPSGNIVLKPYGGTQISTTAMYFKNKNTSAAGLEVGEDIITYDVDIVGYSCVATSKNEDDPIKVATTLPTTGTAKDITVKIQMGTPVQASAVTDTAVGFKQTFVTAASVDVTKLSEEDYNAASEDSTYTKLDTATGVSVAPEEYIPFRVIGEMNTSAKWQAGDKLSIVPVFSVGVSVTEKQ